jgi:hypothetical protein
MLLSFITDVTTKKYYYNQDFVLLSRGRTIPREEASCRDTAKRTHNENSFSSLGTMKLFIKGKGYELKTGS